MLRIAKIGAVLLALAAAVVFLIPALISGERFRPLLETQLAAALGRSVSIGSCSLRVIPPSLKAENLRVAEDPEFGKEPFAAAREFTVNVRLLPLLRGQVEVASIRLIEPSISLIRNRKGVYNTASIRGQGTAPGGGGPAIGRVTIERGRLVVRTPEGPPAEYSNLNVTADGPDVSIESEIAPNPRTKATVRGKARIVSGGDIMNLDGSLEASGLVLSGKPWPHPLRAEFTGTSSKGVLTWKKLQISAGKLNASAAGTIDINGEEPAVDLRADLPKAAITELAEMAAGLGVAFAPGYEIGGTVAARIQARGRMSSPSLQGAATIEDLIVRGGGIKDPVRVPRLALAFTPETIRSEPFTVQTAGTRLNGHFSLSQYSTAPRLEAAVFTEKSNLADLIRIAQAYGVAAAEGATGSGQLDLALRIHGSIRKGAALQYTGKGRLEGASITLRALAKPIENLSATAHFTADSVAVEQARFKLGGTNWSGSLRAADFASPRIEFDLEADRLSLLELRGLTQPGGGGEQGPAPAGGGAARLRAAGTLKAGTLLLEPLTLSAVRATCTFENGVLRLDPVTAGSYGGTVAGGITADLRTATPAYTVKAKLDRVDSAQLLAAVSPIRQVVSGPLSAQGQFQISPGPGGDLMRGLSGSMSMRFSEGKLLPLDVLKEAGTLARFVKIPQTQFTNFVSLSGDIAFQNGVGTTQNLRMELDRGAVDLSGTVNLAEQTVNMKLLTTLNRQLSEEVGGSRIGGYLTAAVSNARGELIIPSLLTGPLSKPRMTPDAATFAKLKLQHAVPALGGATGSIVEAVKGNKEGLGGILDALGARRKKK